MITARDYLLAIAQTADDYGTGLSASYCPKLSITMQRGARDVSYSGQVSELQKFLSDYYDIDPNEIVTGFFGRITQGYVQQFQREQGLPTFGIAGSMTRAAIAKVCSNISVTDNTSISSSNASLSISPTSGAAPLNVQFTLQGLNLPAGSATYTLDFGDGSAVYSTNATGKDSAIHTYSQPGTYIAALKKTPGAQKDVDIVSTVTVAVRAANSTGATTISVTYPQTGYSLDNSGAKSSGQIATIQWNEQNGDYPVNIWLLNQNNQIIKLIANNTPDTGNYVWMYDSTISTGSYQIQIDVLYPSGKSGQNTAYSGFFTLTAPSASTPTITTVSPNQGSANTTATIYGTNLTGASSVQFYNSSGQNVAGISSPSISSINSTSLTFTIGGVFAANVEPGTYQVKVVNPSGTSNGSSFTLIAQ